MVLCDTEHLVWIIKLKLGILVLEMEICLLVYCQGYLKCMKRYLVGFSEVTIGSASEGCITNCFLEYTKR